MVFFRETKLRVIANEYAPTDVTPESQELEDSIGEEKESVGHEEPSRKKGIRSNHKKGKCRQSGVSK